MIPYGNASTREINVLAEDPTVLASNGKPLLTKVRVPLETVLPGPRGARIEVVDYDSATGHFYEAFDFAKDGDIFATNPSAAKITSDPRYHAQQVYGVAAATLFEFERALGRSLAWGFDGRSHQLKIIPHAMREENAFYSREDEALCFGYFEDPHKNNGTVFTCSKGAPAIAC